MEFLAEPLHRLSHRGVRWRIQLLPDERFVHARVLQCCLGIAGGGERIHQLDGDSRAERIGRGEAPPVIRRTTRIARISSGDRQLLERITMQMGEPSPLPLYPPLELGRAIEV